MFWWIELMLPVVKEFRIKGAAHIGIQGRIRVHMRTRGHDLWEPLDITEVWEYISKSPWCKVLSLYYRLSYTHSLDHRDYWNSTSSQCSDCQSPRVITSSHKTSDMHDLIMIFDQQDLFTHKLFNEFLFMKYEEFYQNIYNKKTSVDTISSFCQRDRFCQREKQVNLNCLEE